MAQFGELALFNSMALVSSGGVFRLNRPSPIDAIEELKSGWTVEVKSKNAFVVARGGRSSDLVNALSEALQAAQQGLDVLSIQGLADLSTYTVEDWHIVWWHELAGTTLRFTEVSKFGFSMTANLTVLDSDGNVKPDPPKPRTGWEESYRYFRLVQVTDDLFDAFRNLYLALESILYDIEPMRIRPNGKPDEGEKSWFTRALSRASLPNLTEFAPPGSTSPIDDIFNDLYRDRRTSLFHAKGNRPHLRPHDLTERHHVESSFNRMTRLYLALVEAHHGVNRRSGGTAKVGFQESTQLFELGTVITVTDEPLPESEISAGVLDTDFVKLATRRAVELDRPFFKSVLARDTVKILSALPHLSQIVVVESSGMPLLISNLDGKLTLDGVNCFEAHLPILMRQPQQPRKIYST
jgi:hypothetical protein